MSITGVATGGMEAAQRKLERTGERIAHSEASPEDMVELLSARNQFETNARVLETDDEMRRKLIDILA